MKYFRQILVYAKPYKIYGVLNIVSNIFYALFGTLAFVSLMPMLKVLFKTAEPITTKPIYEGVTKLGDYIENSINYFITIKINTEGEMKALLFMIVIVISTFLLKNIFGYLAMYFITFLRNGVLKDIRNDLYEKTVDLPLAYFSEKRKGDIIARISTDVLEIQHSFLSILELIVREPLMILFTIFAMLALSPQLTLFVFIFIPIAGLGGLRVIKGFNAEGYFNSKFQESTSRFYRFSNSLLNRQNLASPLSEFLGIGVIAILLWYGGSLVLVSKTLAPDAFIVYMGLAYNILTPAKAISKAVYGVKKGDAAAERVLEILHTTSPLADKPNALVKVGFDSSISLENISFKYDDEYVLKNFSLEIPKGKTVAFVGQSGSGKSTIANLLTRFYDVNEGSIKIDGIDIRDITKKSLRSLQGLVSQDSILFNDSIKNNILLGIENKTEAEIMEAAKIANAHEFINEMPNGYDSNIGDSGNKLSGGQKQRLSIARAVLKNPPIMILDEATSALDTESERLVQDALEKMMKNRTSVVIAHRLSTVQKADLIVVLLKGKIIEQGNHEELISKNGVYTKLVEMQTL